MRNKIILVVSIVLVIVTVCFLAVTIYNSNTDDVGEYIDEINKPAEPIDKDEWLKPTLDVDDSVVCYDLNTIDLETYITDEKTPNWLVEELIFYPDDTRNITCYAAARLTYGDDILFENVDKTSFYSFDDGSYTVVYNVNSTAICFTFDSDTTKVYVYELDREKQVIK